MGPNGARVIFVLLIQTFPTFWAERILILRIFIFWILLVPTFPDFQVPDFQISRNLAWAHLGPGLDPAWARAWAQAGPKLGARKIQKIKILKIKIRSAQNVGKVWISRKKNLPAPFGALWAHFLRGPEKCKKCKKNAYFPWWALAAIHSGWGYWYTVV